MIFYCKPNVYHKSAFYNLDSKVDKTPESKYYMVNINNSIQLEDITKARLGYRLCDSTLDIDIIKQQVAISAALTDYAEREAIKKNGYSPLTPAVKGNKNVKIASLLSKIFRKDSDRRQAANLFAINNPVEY